MEFNYFWWIQVIEIPALTGLFFLQRSTQKNLITEISRIKDDAKSDMIKQAENLASFKLEVALHYCSINYIREIESRLTNHLLRIEEKLEKRKVNVK